MKKRHTLLSPVSEQLLQTGDPRYIPNKDPFITLSEMGRSTVLRTEGNMLDPLPDWIAALQKGEVDIVLGSNDYLTPEDTAIAELAKIEGQRREAYWKTHPYATEEELEQAARYFPQADQVNVVRISDWSHHDPAINAPRFGEIMADVMRRAMTARVSAAEAPAATPQGKQTLYY